MARLIGFPSHVNEVSARLVASGVILMALATIVLDLPWLTLLLAYGFLARVLTGPRLSPLGLLVTKVITPRLPITGRMVAGPPKRFAQGMGLAFSFSAAVLALGFGQRGLAYVLVGLLACGAALEAIFNFCVGCRIYGALTHIGVIPESVCVDCTDIWNRTKRDRKAAAV